MAAGLSREIPITEYLPKKIKMAITGNGNASKEQVALMLKSLLNLKTLPKNLDATDGLAAAVCHFYNAGKITQGKNYSGWGAFVKQNPKKSYLPILRLLTFTFQIKLTSNKLHRKRQQNLNQKYFLGIL